MLLSSQKLFAVKNTFIKQITIIGLFMVVILQSFWIINTYNIMKDQITRRSSVLLEEAFFIECIITLSSITTEGAKLIASDDNNPHTNYSLINE